MKISEPVLARFSPRLPTGSAPNPYSPAHRSTRFLRWPGDPGRSDRQAPARGYWAEAHAGSGQGARSRPPFDRLQWWTVRHQLRDRLKPYEATDASPMFWRGASWTTLKYWAMLLDEDDAGLLAFAGIDSELPDPDEWFGKVKA